MNKCIIKTFKNKHNKRSYINFRLINLEQNDQA